MRGCTPNGQIAIYDSWVVNPIRRLYIRLNLIQTFMTKSILFLLLLMPFLLQGQASNKAKYKEFNFWIGEWDVYKNGTDTIVGSSQIESILGGIAIQETYHSTRGAYKGTSLNKYNPALDKWEQFWVDNGGLTLHIQGGLEAGKMVLKGEMPDAKGTNIWNKITWIALPDGRVRQVWKQSKDDGKTWTQVFDGDYRKKP